MSRIIAGTYGGRRLATPHGQDTRPTADRVREALFSALDAAHVALRPALPRPVRRLRRGRAGGGLPGAAPCAAGRVRPEGGTGDPGQHRRAGAGYAAVAGRRPATGCRRSAGRRPTAGGAYDVVFADPPYEVGPRRRSPRCWPRWSDRDWLDPGGHGHRGAFQALARSRMGPPASLASALVATERPCFGTVADHEHQRASAGRSVPGPSTRSPTGTWTSSAGPAGCTTRSSSRCWSTSRRAACSATPSGWTC